MQSVNTQALNSTRAFPDTRSPEWEQALLLAAPRTSAEQVAEFLLLVDAAEGHVSPGVAAALMRTFSGAPDYGTQERVCCVLASATPEVLLHALLEEIPRLVREAPQWAESLLCTEIEFRATMLEHALLQAKAEVQSAVLSIVSNRDFQAFQPKAVAIQELCSKHQDD